jgi:hypothetical protein
MGLAATKHVPAVVKAVREKEAVVVADSADWDRCTPTAKTLGAAAYQEMRKELKTNYTRHIGRKRLRSTAEPYRNRLHGHSGQRSPLLRAVVQLLQWAYFFHPGRGLLPPEPCLAVRSQVFRLTSRPYLVKRAAPPLRESMQLVS